MCSLCGFPVAKNHNFWANFDCLGFLYRPLLPLRAKCALPQQTHQGIWLRAKFRLDRFILSPSEGENPQLFSVLWTSAFSGVDSWRQSELNTGAQLQTFTYPMASTSSLYSGAFMAKSGEQTLKFTSVRNRQTNRQKTQRFWPPRRRVKSEPHQTWHGDRGPRARSCTSKTFWGLTHSFAARGR